MPSRKKFDKLGINPRFEDDGEKKPFLSHDISEKEPSDTYSLRPARKKKASIHKAHKVYEVGSLEVYAVFLVSFVLTVINKFLINEGAYNGLDKNVMYTIQCILCPVMLLLPAALYCKIRKKPIIDTFSAYRFSPGYIPFVFLSFLLLTFVIAAERFAIDAFFPTVYSEQSISLAESENKLGVIISYAVFPAIFEELFFRGILQNEISEKAGGLSGIIVSALTFALIHFDARYFIIYLCSGLILAVCAHVTNSVFPGIVIHAFNNIVSLAFSSRLAFVATENSGNMLVLIILTLIAFLVLLFYLRSLESLCIKKAVFEDIVKGNKHKITEKDAETEEYYVKSASDNELSRMYYRNPFRLLSPSGYSLHKFLRVVFSPAIIVSTALFFFVVSK